MKKMLFSLILMLLFPLSVSAETPNSSTTYETPVAISEPLDAGAPTDDSVSATETSADLPAKSARRITPVADQQAAVLPQTGEQRRKIYTIVGIILVAVITFILIQRNRKKK